MAERAFAVRPIFSRFFNHPPACKINFGVPSSLHLASVCVTSFQRKRDSIPHTPPKTTCQSMLQENEQTLSSLGDVSRRDSSQPVLAAPASKLQAAFASNSGSARRRSCEVAVGSGRYAASVVRTSGGRKRIRRSKDSPEDEGDDDGTDERYSSLEDAPIFGSVHGDSFDYQDQDGPSPLGEDGSSERKSPGNDKPLEENQGSKKNGSLQEERGSPQIEAVLAEQAKGQAGELAPTETLPEEKFRKPAITQKLDEFPVGKVLNNGPLRLVGSLITIGDSEARRSIRRQRKKGVEFVEEGVVEAGSVKELAAEKPALEKRPAAKKVRRRKVPKRRLRGADGAAASAKIENGRPRVAGLTSSREESSLENGAQTADVNLRDRLASGQHAGTSSGDEFQPNSGVLQFRLVSGRAFVVTLAATGRVDEFAEKGESEGLGVLSGAAILGAASSLVETLVDSAQSPGEVPGQIANAVGDVKDAVVETVSSAVEAMGTGVGDATDAVTETVSQLSEQVMEVVSSGVEEITDTVDTVTSSVAETVDSVTSSVAETVGDMGGAVVSLMTEEEELGDTEFEAFRNQAGPQLRGRAGLDNLRVLADGATPFHLIQDAYTLSLKLPPLQFSLVVALLPLLMSLLFTGVYLLDMQGLVPDDSVQRVFAELQKGGHEAEARAYALFQVFMFSLSLATGLQPVLAPVTPFSFLAANVNALLAQLLFVFLSGTVFARLSQRSRPIRCSTVALICPPCHENRPGKEWSNRVLMARYVLVGTRPSELVDVKVDLTFQYNTVARNGSYFNRQVSLKLVRSEVAHQVGGMLVRHVIDESSPLYRRTEEMLKKEDAVFTLSVVGLERSSMQSVFELQHYCVADGDIIWDAEFEDVVLVNKSMQRVIDQSKLSRWRSVPTTAYRTMST